MHFVPFKIISLIKSKIMSLPAFMQYYKRFGSSAFFNHISKNGSLTIETALVFPFFIMVLLCFIYIINIIGFQQTIQLKLEDTARKISSSAYIAADMQDDSPDSPLLSVPIFRTLFFTEDIKKLCKTTYIKNNELGISFLHSSIDTEKQTADIVITYSIQFPFLPGNLFSIPFVQRCQIRLFTGYIQSGLSDGAEEIVYMTANGRVYHTDKYCSYLVHYTDSIALSSLPLYEKSKGVYYTPCNMCKPVTNLNGSTSIYISSTGNVYHFSKDCYHLSSHIFSCPAGKVKDLYPICSRCSKNRKEKETS